jgi:hypothetical protein
VDESAFPHVNHHGQKITGMTLRDYFAGLAMQGMMARDVFDAGQARPEQRAKLAYIEADAMMEARIPKPLPPVTVNTVLNKCTVCGLQGFSGVVCYHPRCPTRVTCT